ncbi:MAG: hypothetical protein GYA23_06460 [Methanomicrobiales archaeon]|nr:hypothetical protein [Methanomicrobiales archaeon]
MDGKTIVDGQIVYVASASQEQVDKVNELWGKDISIGEYLTQVHPSLLEEMPPDVKEEIFKTKWRWPTTEEMAAPANQEVSDAALDSSNTDVDCSVFLTSAGSAVNYGGGALYNNNPAPNYLQSSTYVYNGASQVVATTGSQGYSVKRVYASNQFVPSAHGTYHAQTFGQSQGPEEYGYSNVNYLNW